MRVSTPSDASMTMVSIRAPVRGATYTAGLSPADYKGFDPRSRAGSDLLNDYKGTANPSFRSALPCGERPTVSVGGTALKMFRSALPCGERQGWSFRRHCPAAVSIRAPVRGATPSPQVTDNVGKTGPPPRTTLPHPHSATYGTGGSVKSSFFTMTKTEREPLGVRPDASASRGRTAPPHTIRGPSRSTPGLAPTCSTRRRPAAPRK